MDFFIVGWMVLLNYFDSLIVDFMK